MRLYQIDDTGLFIGDIPDSDDPIYTQDNPNRFIETEIETVTGEDGKQVIIETPVYDENGNTQLNHHYTLTPCPAGFILGKYDRATDTWSEGGTAPEPVTQPPTQDERLSAVEAAVSALMGVG